MKRFLEFFIRGDNKQFKDSVRDTKQESNKFADFMKGIGKKLVAALAVTAVIAGFRKLISTMIETADRVSDLADITGMTTDAIQEYQYVAKMAGVNTEAVTAAVEGLTQRLARATTEASPLNIALKQLGINVRDASGAMRSGAVIMDDAIGKLAAMENITERNVLGSQIFAGAWKDMAPILGMGAEGIEKLRREAHELGVVMDKDTIDKTNKLRQEQERLKAAATGLGRELGSVFIPILTKLASALVEVTKASKSAAEGLSAVVSSENLSRWDKFKTFLGLLVPGTNAYANSVMNMVGAIQEKTDAQDDDLQQGEAIIAQAEEQIGLLEKLRTKLEEATEARDKSTDPMFIQRQNQTIAALREQIAYIEQYTGELRHAYEATEDLSAAEKIMNDMTLSLDNMGDAAERSTDRFILFGGQAKILTDQLRLLAEIATAWGEDMMWAGVSASGSLKEYGKTVAEVTKRNIAAFLAESVAAALRGAFTRLGPVGIALAPAIGGLAAATFNAVVPSFAEGGAAFGPTLALVGEAPGISRSNPELIGTADQLGLSRGNDVRFRIEGDMLEGISHKRKQMEIYFG